MQYLRAQESGQRLRLVGFRQGGDDAQVYPEQLGFA